MTALGRQFRALLLAMLACVLTLGAEEPIVPVTVCEVLRDLSGQEGKPLAVLGRYSFREGGRWVGEQTCDPTTAATPALWLVEDSKDGPKPPGNFELDATAVRRKLTEVARHTSLSKFRFGTPDYDRWVVIYGRVEPRKPEDKKASANLVIRGNAVIVFLTP
jgi:hypothetical protein